MVCIWVFGVGRFGVVVRVVVLMNLFSVRLLVCIFVVEWLCIEVKLGCLMLVCVVLMWLVRVCRLFVGLIMIFIGMLMLKILCSRLVNDSVESELLFRLVKCVFGCIFVVVEFSNVVVVWYSVGSIGVLGLFCCSLCSLLDWLLVSLV